MNVEEFGKMTPYERESLQERIRTRQALEAILKIWEKMAE